MRSLRAARPAREAWRARARRGAASSWRVSRALGATRALDLEPVSTPALLAPRGIPGPFVEARVPVAIDAKHGRAARAVVLRAHEGARQQALPFQGHAGRRQVGVRRRPVIAQQMQDRLLVAHAAQRFGEPRLGILHLGPGRIEQMIGETEDAGTQLAALAAHALKNAEPLTVAEDHVERIVVRAYLAKVDQCLEYAAARFQRLGNQPSAARRIGVVRARMP